MHLKWKHRTIFGRKRRLQKCPQSRVMTNSATTPKSPIFWDFAKGGPRETGQKSRSTLGAWKSPLPKSHDNFISMHLKCQHRTTFGRKRRLQKCPQSRVMTNSARTPKSPIFWDFAKGGPRETGPKSRSTLGAWKSPLRKSHDNFISMRLKCQHRTIFGRKRQLQKCPQSRVMTNSARTPKSPIFWDFAKGGPRETGPKSRSTLGAWKSPLRKLHDNFISMRLKCQHRTTFGRKRRLQKCPQSRVMTNSARTPKSPIFWDFAKGGPRETGLKRRSTLGAWKSPLRKLHDNFISMRLKCQHRTTFGRKRRLQKCPQSRVMTNSARTPKSPIFWDFAKGGPRETGPKSRSTLGAWKSPLRKLHDNFISMRLKCQHRTTFGRKRRLQKCPQSRVMTNSARTPKSPIFWDFAKGGPRETGPKSRSTLGAWKSPLRKSHDNFISMPLKCQHRTTFGRKRRFQKCPQSRVMTNSARTPKSPIFWDFAKGGPRETGPKSRWTLGIWKSPLCKLHDNFISMRLKCQHRTTFGRKRRLQKCPQSRVMTNSARTPKSLIFWDFAKGGPRETGPKSRSTLGAWKSPLRKLHDNVISMRLKCQHRTTFGRKRRLQKCPQSRVMTNSARTPKSPIFWDFAKGGPRETGPKSRSTLGAWKSPLRKSHDNFISMRLKCQHRTTFGRKRQLQKCPQSRVMTNSARTPKSPIFWDFAKGGTKGNWPKK